MANYQPPTEDVPIFNGKYFTAENITTANGDGRYLKLIAQGDEDMNNYDILNINQVDTQSVKFGDGTIQTTAGGGGGGVQNPMTSNLDAGNFFIQNAGLIETFYLENTKVNNADAIKYINFGAITAGDKYLIGRSNNRLAMEGNIMVLIRTLDAGFKQEFLAEVIAFPDRSVIRIINNVCESDTIPITEILYEDDPLDPLQSVLCFKCGVSATRCDILVYQNGNDNNTLGSQFLIPTTITSIPTSTNVYTSVLLEVQTAGTSGNYRTAGTTFSSDTQTITLATNAIRELTATADIQLLNNINLNNNSIKNTNTISVDNIGVNLNSEIQSTASINLGGNDLQNTNNVYVDSLRENTPGNSIVVHNTLNMNNNHIHNLSDPIQNKDGANKQYVDTAVAGFLTNPLNANLDGASLYKGINFVDPTNAQDLATKNYVDTTGGSGVQNPMTSNLDGGTFNITNVGNFSNVPTTGNFFSNGLFQHSNGAFQIGGSGMTTDTDVNFNDSATPILQINKTARQINLANGSTTYIKPGAVLSAGQGGAFITYQTSTPATAYNGEITTSFYPPNPNRRNDFLTLTGYNYGNSVIPMAISPMTTQQYYTANVADYVPFTAGLGWNAGNNGDIIPLVQRNTLVQLDGLPPGINNHDANAFPFDAHFIGIGLNCASQLGGWVLTGVAQVELVYSIIGASYVSFVPPVIVAQSGAGGNLTIENIRLPQSSWVEASSSSFGGIQLGLQLNISGADIIDTQDPSNKSINACGYLLCNIPIN